MSFFESRNVFLASIPYVITMFLSEKKDLPKTGRVFAFIVWLLFLSNALYIITDLYHLQRSTAQLIRLDTLVIITFATTGAVLFYCSLNKMMKIIKKHYKIKQEKIVVILICFLSAFGIYIGRYLRFNSWEILSNPKPLINNVLLQPKAHIKAWLFTILFGLLLSFGHFIFKRFALKKTRI
ncbi:DUF1361 domain-containing protein [Lacinutrix neustonica]|uniref:DUF1361 domain-containing protein n=1 Tax=Lacinutrix neustonica TaxID=2980107 RepID=A0A9E8N0Y8_9FLAO|nr:DUF1361 domain-containing protein [Lacinutrix neustonica]WAC03854.1 DUF1361 domain-containing protein [Lacinutrix neustonica]